MRILLSNDDGINAEGLQTLEAIAAKLSDDVWTVAPEQDSSGMARSITITRPLRIRQAGERRYAVDGTPTDAVHLGIHQVLKDMRPDLILSGVNNGQNIAEDVTMSGTIAAAFQGMTLGVPSIALSLARTSRFEARWETAEAHAPGVIRTLLEEGWPSDVVVNLNFPDCGPEEVAGVEVTRQGRRENLELYAEERTDLRQQAYYWFGFHGHPSEAEAGTDVHALEHNRVSVTPLHLSLTHEAAQRALQKRFSQS
ncbi:5'/3'-nucleotidase SurE [Parvularcula dongshanensis]|uniref:5'-nucleotidase SurE n=1 Tax=Parvularcula dongshanensis TaxID=1173995 RepID=A0A840I405_9PROT|nr:5'/3'-nucleotidase SurE [Parvularcula dongshanensis]MBB4659065.1 5'-nucleotidase [Parvularcula dongshanensis]